MEHTETLIDIITANPLTTLAQALAEKHPHLGEIET
ncbi:MAG: hypothetical protein ACJAZH_000845 [Roseivirga sp.]|jgi:hypothetical protein